jgi:sec-independent protein translocase protein TatB
MFNIGPLELLVLAVVGLIVLGPDKLPGLARDAARMLRTLRDLAQGARTQLRDELGPEFADMDLRSLDPRTAISRAVLGDDADRVDLRKLSPRAYLQDALLGTDEKPAGADVPQRRPAQQPLRPGESAPYDTDAT